MKSPFALAALAGVLTLLVALALPLRHLLAPPAGSAPDAALRSGPAAGPPWQVEVAADGALLVFGLALGRDRLADVERRHGDALQVALVARLGEAPALEALLDPFAAGFVSGRLVLAFAAPDADLRRWHARATGSAPMEGGARRFTLHPADRAAAQHALLHGASFVPAIRLSDADVRLRFGAAHAELALAGGAAVLLYPARGLAVSVAADRRSVFQYVAPRDFDARLAAPLAASAPAR